MHPLHEAGSYQVGRGDESHRPFAAGGCALGSCARASRTTGGDLRTGLATPRPAIAPSTASRAWHRKSATQEELLTILGVGESQPVMEGDAGSPRGNPPCGSAATHAVLVQVSYGPLSAPRAAEEAPIIGLPTGVRPVNHGTASDAINPPRANSLKPRPRQVPRSPPGSETVPRHSGHPRAGCRRMLKRRVASHRIAGINIDHARQIINSSNDPARPHNSATTHRHQHVAEATKRAGGWGHIKASRWGHCSLTNPVADGACVRHAFQATRAYPTSPSCAARPPSHPTQLHTSHRPAATAHAAGPRRSVRRSTPV